MSIYKGIVHAIIGYFILTNLFLYITTRLCRLYYPILHYVCPRIRALCYPKAMEYFLDLCVR